MALQNNRNKICKLKIFEDAYKNVNSKYHSLEMKKTQNINLFIDTMNIYNKNGSEDVGYGSNPKKRETKLSLICDDKKMYFLQQFQPQTNMR